MKLKSSIILVVIIGLIIPVTVSSLFILDNRKQELYQRLRDDQQHALEILALGMQEPLWNYNPKGATPLFLSILNDTRIVSISVLDNKNNDFLYQAFPERQKGNVNLLEKKVTYQDQEIGKVIIEFDSYQLDQEISRSRKIFVGTATAQLLLSLMLIVSLIQKRILDPIRRLMKDSVSLSKKLLNTPFVWNDRDELGSLGLSLERTRLSLNALFEEIETKNRLLEEDIKKREMAESELNRHRYHLEDLVMERTIELQREKEKADIANKAKSGFLSNMSHELRTPLNAILGYAQILQRETHFTEKQRLAVQTIYQSGDHLLTLINELLDLAKIEAGKFEVLLNPVNFPQFLHSLVNIVRVKAEQKDLQFTTEFDKDLAKTVMIDEKRLRQVLLNLLGNAIKFTEKGSVCLSVELLEQLRGEQRLRFTIKDTGIGMRADQLEKIFTPFEQVGSEENRSSGTGLGLTISRQLTRMMGSDIEVMSMPGHGSQFSFELRLAVCGDADFNMAFDQIPTGYSGERKKILIADDIQANYEMLRDFLESLGFVIEIAENGQIAIEKTQSFQPDLILMDILMPVLDGIEAMTAIRTLPNCQDLPIFALSASVTADEHAKTIVAGADEFFSKPVKQSELLERISRHLNLQLHYRQFSIVLESSTVTQQALPFGETERSELERLARAGNMRDILDFANKIATPDEASQQFMQRIVQLAKSYQSKAILQLICGIANKGGGNA